MLRLSGSVFDGQEIMRRNADDLDDILKCSGFWFVRLVGDLTILFYSYFLLNQHGLSCTHSQAVCLCTVNGNHSDKLIVLSLLLGSQPV